MKETSLASVPFFLFMGYLLEQSGLMERLFRGVQLLFASLRGSLYLAVLITATIFAAPGSNALQTADRHPSKPHPSMVEQALADAGASPETTVVIGDTAFDMGMAANAGVTGIGAGWGYHDAAELLAAGATAVADAPLDVLDHLPGETERRYG